MTTNATKYRGVVHGRCASALSCLTLFLSNPLLSNFFLYASPILRVPPSRLLPVFAGVACLETRPLSTPCAPSCRAELGCQLGALLGVVLGAPGARASSIN